jgi:hypothetical protein
VYRNLVLEHKTTGVRIRILDKEVVDNVPTVWTFALTDPKALPRAYEAEALQWAIEAKEFAAVDGIVSASVFEPSQAALQRRDSAYASIEPLIQTTDIFRPKLRSSLVSARAKELGCSEQTLYTYLRQWWREGQNRNTLLPSFHTIGNKSEATANRGRPPKYCRRPIYQMATADYEAIKGVLSKYYLKNKAITLAATYQRLLEEHYSYVDGNGERWLNALGERPTETQFRRYVKKHLRTETAVRARQGDVEFALNHRATLGSIRLATFTVGDRYEIDATIVDLLLVHADDRSRIIGKPVLYTVRDTKSNLCVGFYVGLENACWLAAMHAIKSISEDKAALCKKYGVPYSASDWPADRVFPKTFVADRGPEMVSVPSAQLADGLESTIENLPTGRADWKPHVECGFKQIQRAMVDVAPGYTPPEDFGKRQRRDPSKDAAMTLHELTAMLLKTIITQNKMPITDYPLTPKYVLAGMQPTPVNIWNAEVRDRAGLLTRHSEADVRFALLPRADATVEHEGIRLGDCYYSAPEAIAEGWFVSARRGRFKVPVSYDRRLVDAIYVHDPRNPTRYFIAHLLEKNAAYRGKSFAEVESLAYAREVMRQEGQQIRRQLQSDFHSFADPIATDAARAAKAASKGKSRSSRKKDTVVDRADALSQQRRIEANISPETKQLEQVAEVVPIGATAQADGPSPTKPATATKSRQQKYQELLDGI